MSTSEVTQKDLHDLLEIFEKKSFEANAGCEAGSVEDEIARKCEMLFKLDYSLIELDNTNGSLSPRYPSRIFIPEYERSHVATTLTANSAKAYPSSPSTITTTTPTTPTTATTTTTTLTSTSLQSSSGANGSGIGRVGSVDSIGSNSSSISFCSSSSSSSSGSSSSSSSNSNNWGTGSNAMHVTFANPLQRHPNPHQYLHQQMQYHQLPAQPTTASAPTSTPAPAAAAAAANTQQHTIYEDLYDIAKVRELITMAKYARCRQRFAVPVIMFRGKYVCRSATISVMPETYGRKVVDYAYDCLSGTTNSNDRVNALIDDENNDPTDESLSPSLNEPSPFSYEEVIKSDIQLLTALNVATIVDLMVEMRKIKYFMAVSSSEKADPEQHYEQFNILSLPYPGCEFFKKFRDNNYMAKNLHYNWKQSFNDATISLPKAGPASDLDIAWHDYKQWDLVLITQNYLKATLRYIQEENSGLLVHCISGWDRTPLFISLVRLSLWADGLIHQSLNALQMAYFTLAYDWFLFGHQLPDRLKRGEDIMFFCFHFLKHITDDEFSVVEHRRRTKTSSSSGSSSIAVLKSDCCDDEPLKEDFVMNIDQDSNDSFSNSSNCDMSITDNFYTTTTSSSTGSSTMASSSSSASTTTTATSTTATTQNASNAGINSLTNRSPNPKRSRTSPISVPGVSATRQRQESTSSNGSWQVVTDTGSIDSLINGSYMMRFVTQQSDNNSALGQGSGGSHSTSTLSNNSNGSGCSGASAASGSGSNANFQGFSSLAAMNSANNARDVPAGPKPVFTLRKQRLSAVRVIFIQAYGKTIGLKFKEGSSMNLATLIGTWADQLF